MIEPKWSGPFTAFQMLSAFMEEAFPGVPYYSVGIINAMHKHAKLIGNELTKGEYVPDVKPPSQVKTQ